MIVLRKLLAEDQDTCSTTTSRVRPSQTWPAHQAAEMMTATAATTALCAVAHAAEIEKYGDAREARAVET